MTRPLRFEPFDASPVAPVSLEPSADWRAGHACGLAEASEGDAHRRALAEEAALAMLADLAFTWAEARAGVLGALVPLFRALGDRLVPDLAGAAFPLHLCDALLRAAAEDVAAVPDLCVCPEDAARLAPILTHAPPVRLVPDPALESGQARIACGGVETALDTPALVAALCEILAAFGDRSDHSLQPEGRRDHG
jgi:hypothetical protein